MKNLMIYISPDSLEEGKKDPWGDEVNTLIKIQIDNGLELGWKRKDIMLVTNFEYKYNGVKSLVISDENFCSVSPTASKILVILYLIDHGIIGEELIWFHDFDAFQMVPFIEEDIKKELDGYDMGLTDYGVSTMNRGRGKRLSTGVLFFNEKARDIFEWIKIKVYQYGCNEEVGLLELTKISKYKLNERIKRFNISYNFATRKRNISDTYKIADKPLKVIHFHPFDERVVEMEEGNNIEVCLHGKNRMGKKLVTNRLIEIFKKHGIK